MELSADRQKIVLGRWTVVVTLLGIIFTVSALWYGNFFSNRQMSDHSDSRNIEASGNAVIVGGDNNGIINTNE